MRRYEIFTELKCLSIVVFFSYFVNMDSNVIKTIQNYFATQPVEKAWLFGSFSRGEERQDSDIDLLVVFNKNANVSLLRHAGMIVELEDRLQRKVDMVTDGNLLPFAVESANRDRVLIYERTA